MPKVYGGRWEIIQSLTEGGQSHLYMVKDQRNEHTEKLVLKRVKNPKRHDRFRTEVNAIKLLDHPNIIRLYDHSALVDGPTAPEDQYLVMPFAEHGDLAGRLKLYEKNIDGVIRVAQTLARALGQAHAAGVIHRDVKPHNILFPHNSHEIWVADFGICLIRENDRSTPDGEIVGPFQYMAPEMEGGGKLEVTPAVDIYSLGKVMYSMLSGGKDLPRERLHEPQYAKVFEGGERMALVQRLLTKMICGPEIRLKTMHQVLEELDRIESWESRAHSVSLSEDTMKALESLKLRAADVTRREAENLDARKRRESATAMAVSGVLDWLEVELRKIADMIREEGTISATVRRSDGSAIGIRGFVLQASVELVVSNKAERMARQHTIRLSVGKEQNVRVRVTSGRQPSMELPEKEIETVQLVLLPLYSSVYVGASSQTSNWMAITTDRKLYQPNAQPGSTFTASRTAHRKSFQPSQPPELMAVRFGADEWHKATDFFQALVQESMKLFIEKLSSA